MDIISRIEKQPTQIQQGRVDDLPQALWIHRTIIRNSQKETPFSLTYVSEAIILTVESNVAKYDRGRMKEVTKRKESKEVASIEEAYYQNEMCRNPVGMAGPHMIREVHEGELYMIIDASDHSLIQTTKGTNLHNFYM
ncbi:hypothetical protein Tco_0109200 [Tanacetum coccineum]